MSYKKTQKDNSTKSRKWYMNKMKSLTKRNRIKEANKNSGVKNTNEWNMKWKKYYRTSTVAWARQKKESVSKRTQILKLSSRGQQSKKNEKGQRKSTWLMGYYQKISRRQKAYLRNDGGELSKSETYLDFQIHKACRTPNKLSLKRCSLGHIKIKLLQIKSKR